VLVYQNDRVVLLVARDQLHAPLEQQATWCIFPVGCINSAMRDDRVFMLDDYALRVSIGLPFCVVGLPVARSVVAIVRLCSVVDVHDRGIFVRR
jgi:hypothetical protein